jgi:uncharacterized protein
LHPYIWLIPLGILIGTLGTLIGAGGGFVLLPALLLLYPDANPETVTSISLAVVFFNAFSGSWAYARMRRIDYQSGWLLAAAAVPGAIIGAWTTAYIPRRLFDALFGALMMAAAFYLFINRTERKHNPWQAKAAHRLRTIIDRDGHEYTYAYDVKLGMGLSMLVGYVSSLLGIGGGIIHVPALARLLNFPVHIATATSHFILAIMALTGTLVHILSGSFAHGGVHRTVYLGIGVLLGAQAGAFLSSYVHGKWIMCSLAIALAIAGVRIFLMAW